MRSSFQGGQSFNSLLILLSDLHIYQRVSLKLQYSTAMCTPVSLVSSALSTSYFQPVQ